MTWLAPVVAVVISATPRFTIEDDEDVAAAFRLLAVEETSGTADKLALNVGDDVDENDCALVEDCRSVEGFPARLNNLDKVSAGCTTAASVLGGIASLAASECFDPAAADKAVGRFADVVRTWLSALVVKASVVGLLLDATSGVNGVAAGAVGEVGAASEFSGLAAVEGVIDEENIGTMVEGWRSAGIEVMSV